MATAQDLIPDETPFAGLSPETMLAAVDSLGFLTDGRLLALNSYENRVYQVGIEDEAPLIAKFYRPGRWTDEAIIEEHAYAAELAEHEIPLVAPLTVNNQTLFQFEGYRFSLTPRCGGRAVEPDRDDQLRWLGRFLGRMHAVGASAGFTHRQTLTVERFGWESRRLLLEKNWIPMHLETAFSGVSEEVLQRCDRAFQNAGADLIRLHGDFHVGNILWRDGPFFVDLDDCMMGPAIQDLWLLLSGHREEMQSRLNVLLEGYEEFQSLSARELGLIEALRSLRILHHAAWIARRWEDPAFPLCFTWFDSNRYWEDLVLNLREQIALLDEPPLSMPPRGYQ